jgi:hypothetical protein
LGTMVRPTTKNVMPKKTSNQKTWLDHVSASCAICGIAALEKRVREIQCTGREYPDRRDHDCRRLSDEDQDHGNDERQQAEKLGSGEADEQTALLAVGSARIAQRAFEERTEDVTNADRSHTGTDCSETSTDELCSFLFHDKLLWEKLWLN